jgi:hypothetical protein
MKNKPTLITLAGAILLASFTLFVSCRHEKANKEEIVHFLDNFSNYINVGDAEKLNSLFEVKLAPKSLKKLISLLTGKSEFLSKEKPLASITLAVEESKIKSISDDLVLAEVQAELTHQDMDKKISSITIKIRKISATQYKIVQIDAKKLIADYAEYAAIVKRKTFTDKDLFEPQTIAAFKTAEQLKTKYDSVLWFAYYNNQTYYYVLKGKWEIEKDLSDNIYRKDTTKDDYKIGLVGPDLKEIIPVNYTLIHNISGTFPNLIEVENGNNKGFFDLNGKEVVQVKYSSIYPIEDENNLAVLKDNQDYYYLKKDFTISEKVNLKLTDFFSKIKDLKTAYNLKDKAPKFITEYNSRSNNGAIYLPPSYLVDLNLVNKELDFINPLRKKNTSGDSEEEEDVHTQYLITPAEKNKNEDNWFEASFYSVRDYFLGGRAEFYDVKKLVLIDKKHDKIYQQSIPINMTDYEGSTLPEGACNINSIRTLNDTLFEVKASVLFDFNLYDSTKYVSGGPDYSYFSIKNGKLSKLNNNSRFGFTKYVKMDDSYLRGCYEITISSNNYKNHQTKTIETITPEMLRYMKNEIYADYRYQFKDKRWERVFAYMEDHYGFDNEKPLNVAVDDSLTEIDKYNINWISQKLKGGKTSSKVLASK